MNTTHPDLPITNCAEEMDFRLKVWGEGYDVYLFNITILTETLYPEVQILSEMETKYWMRMDNESRTLVLNATDPAGVERASLYGLYPPNETDTEGLLLLDSVENISNGVPFEFEISIPLVLEYAKRSDQVDEDVIEIDLMIVVWDKTGISAHPSTIVFYNLREIISDVSSTSMTSGANPDPYDVSLIFGFLGMFGVGFSMVVLVSLPRMKNFIRTTNTQFDNGEGDLNVALEYLDQIQDEFIATDEK